MSLLLLLSGCVLRAPELIGLEVDAVEISQVQTARFGMIVGGQRVNALMTVTDTQGEVYTVPIRGSGPSVGLMFSVSTTAELSFGKAKAHLSCPDATSGPQLFGRYRGATLSGGWILGYESTNSRNRHGCDWSQSGAVFGFGAWGGVEWIWLRPEPLLAQGAGLEGQLADRPQP